MGVIREAFTASAGLFTVAFVVGYYLEKRSEEVITRLVNKVLDDPGLEEIVYDYVNVLVRKFLRDPFGASKFEEFAANVIRSQSVQSTVRDLIVKSVLDDKFLQEISDDVLLRIKRIKPDLEQLTERKEIIERTFVWKQHEFNYLALASRRFDHFNFTVNPEVTSSNEIIFHVFRPPVKDLARQIFYHQVDPVAFYSKMQKTLKNFKKIPKNPH
jgi:hypothetical protein